MNFVTIIKTDYGHQVDMLVKEYDEVSNTLTVVDLSGFDDRILIVKKPDGGIVTISGVFITDGSDGWFRATASQSLGVFDQSGYYEFGGLFRNASQQFHTSTFGEDVRVNLDA